MSFLDCEHSVSEWADEPDEYGIVHKGTCQTCGITMLRRTFTEEGFIRLGNEILVQDLEFIFRGLGDD